LPDLTGLPADQIKNLDSWEATYKKKYIWVGVLDPSELKVSPEVLARAVELEKNPRGP
jgi:hypothetical protein